ncbi:shikimate kinase AroK [Parvibium lacunae]|uniref:Shikimate kinase n=1 Tax=Parvibium lacunae TaxID=1888893 RepID=A0A368KYW5_9BURK|nr:shikimate kinase AroK [Parvibium lacunae]RCS56586.1 shikimate kinase AroK [Parvibium lacunae]
MNVALIGPMGAGKSTVGRLLARELGLSFVDSDHEIEARTGVKIPVIFDLEGEAGFRRREAQIVDELTQRDNMVLATGGGAILQAENRDHLRSRTTVIYLRASLNELWHRVQHDRNRPLLQSENPRQKLAQLLEQRMPLYEQTAHFTVESNGHSAHHVINKIMQLLQPAKSIGDLNQ